MRASLSRLSPAPELITIVVLLVAVASSVLGASFDPTIRLGLVYLLATIGLSVFAGASGVMPFGQVAFMAIGAYAAAICRIPVSVKTFEMDGAPSFLVTVHLSAVLATVVAGAVAAVCAAVLALALMRMSGLSAGLASFAVLVMVQVVASNWTEVTGGTAGITGVPRSMNAVSGTIWVVIAIVLATVFAASRHGLRLRASREDEVAARSLGVGVFTQRTLAFLLSAFIMGVAGGLYAQQVGSFQPSSLYLNTTFLLIAMLIIGGFTSLSGAVVGSVALTIVAEVLRQIEKGPSVFGLDVPSIGGLRDIALAVLMLAVLLLRPGGLLGGSELRWTRPRFADTVSTDRSVNHTLEGSHSHASPTTSS